jgi:hypothetical protein
MKSTAADTVQVTSSVRKVRQTEGLLPHLEDAMPHRVASTAKAT